jgi:hypothetical protein
MSRSREDSMGKRQRIEEGAGVLLVVGVLLFLCWWVR